MTDLEAFTAAYMAACKDRPADYNEIGYWYARQLWDAAAKAEREAGAKLAESYPCLAIDGAEVQTACRMIAAAIRARSP